MEINKNIEELKLRNEIYKSQIEEKKIELQNRLLDNYDKLDRIELFIDKINNCKIDNDYYEILKNIEIKIDILNDNKEIKKDKMPLHEYGPYVQCYDPITKKLVRTFISITDATREIKEASYSQIKHASTFNKIYLNYRWILLDNKDDLDKEINDIGESTLIQNRNTDMIAVINKNNEIEEVYSNQKEVSEKFNKCISNICIIIKNKKIIDNKKLVLWNDITDDIKNKFLENNQLPEIKEKLKGKKINKINPDNNEIIKTYLSITDLIKEIKISPKTIKKVIENKEIYKDYLWSY